MPGAASIEMNAKTAPQEKPMNVLIYALGLLTVVLLVIRQAKRDPCAVWVAKWERGKRTAARGGLLLDTSPVKPLEWYGHRWD
jgi:hypothetical protein